MIDVVLHQPEIPPNTGNVIRLCSNTGFRLHLIHPLGFSMQNKRLRRAGLDYHETASITQHASFLDYKKCQTPPRILAFSTRGTQMYTRCHYRAGDALIFGSETKGLPQSILESLPSDQVLRLPMLSDSRSLNLSNTVAIAIYEVWRQLDFSGATAGNKTSTGPG